MRNITHLELGILMPTMAIAGDVAMIAVRLVIDARCLTAATWLCVEEWMGRGVEEATLRAGWGAAI